MFFIFVLTGKKNEECSGKKSVSKTRQRSSVQQQQDNRCALVDISNDSPIVGLANGKDMIETPLSSTAKKKTTMTPGSGEALLRGQVKTLLQRVEEEAVISKLSMEIVAPFLKLANSSSVSPMSLLAPTPANTPQVPNLSEVSPPSCVLEEQLLISRVSTLAYNRHFVLFSSCPPRKLREVLKFEMKEKTHFVSFSNYFLFNQMD